MFSLLDLAAILLTLSAFLGWLNHKFIPLPHTIGLLVMSVVTSVLLVGFDLAFPAQHIFEPLTAALLQIDFTSVVMNGMLAFLLFAGALQVDLGKLRSRAIPVAALAGVGTVISTAAVGAGIWRGGISVALALSVPDSPARSTILAATYAVVLFSIIVQGATLGFIARRTIRPEETNS